MACVRIQPIVDRLEKEFPDSLHIIRLDIQSATGRALAPDYGFQFTPTFVLFDAEGNELWREVGTLLPEKVRASVQP